MRPCCDTLAVTENALPAGHRTVLVVDDESTVRMTLVYCLELGGFQPLEAASAEAARMIVERQHVDAALIDIRMPGTNGFECAAQLREKTRQRERPFLIWFMSGCPMPKDRERAALLGARDVLRKPFHVPTLLREIAEAVGR